MNDNIRAQGQRQLQRRGGTPTLSDRKLTIVPVGPSAASAVMSATSPRGLDGDSRNNIFRPCIDGLRPSVKVVGCDETGLNTKAVENLSEHPDRCAK